MPTKNQRVASYLPSHLNDRLQSFKVERSIEGDSQALIVVLSEFFGVSQKVAHQGSSVNLELQERVKGLEERITQLKDELMSELRRELLENRSSSIEQAKAEVKDELLSELKGESLRAEVVPGQLELIPDHSELNELLSESALAKRLRCGASTIREWKKKGKDVLLEKTRAKNQGIGWIYDSEIGQYRPEIAILSDSLKA